MLRLTVIALLALCACSEKTAPSPLPPTPPEHVGHRPIYAPNGHDVWAWSAPKGEDGTRALYVTKAGQAAGIRCVLE